MSKNSSRSAANPKIFKSLNPQYDSFASRSKNPRNEIVKRFTLADKIKNPIVKSPLPAHMRMKRFDEVIVISSSSLREPVNIFVRLPKEAYCLSDQRAQKDYRHKKGLSFYRTEKIEMLNRLRDDLWAVWEEYGSETEETQIMDYDKAVDHIGEHAILEFERDQYMNRPYKNVS